MNKIYKVIWSKIRNCYVVVSEIAKRNSKGSAVTDRRRGFSSVLAAMVLASVLNIGISAPVWADGSAEVKETDLPVTIQGGNGILVSAEGDIISISAEENDTLESLKKYMKFNDYSGSSPVIDSISKNSFVLGADAEIHVLPGESASSEYNLAIGSNSKIFAGGQGGNNTALGASAVVGAKDIYVTSSTEIGGQSRVFGSSGISIGSNAQVGLKQEIPTGSESGSIYAYADQSIAIGASASAYSDQSIAIGASSAAGAQFNKNATYSDRSKAEPVTTAEATAIGYKATASNKYSTAVGSETQATYQSSTAIGHLAKAIQTSGTAIGSSSYASGSSSTAIGTSSKATNTNSTAIGETAKAYGQNSSAIGGGTISTGIQNISIGSSAYSLNNETMALGFHAAAYSAESIAFGHDTLAFGDGSLAVGHMALVGMPVKEKIITINGNETKYIELPTNSKISDQKVYIQTSDGTVLLYQTSINNTTGKETKTYYKVKAVPDEENGWKFVKVNAAGEAVGDNDNSAVKYLAKETQNKDIRTFGSKVNHIDYFYIQGQENSTKTEPLDGGIALGSYTVAQGEHSLALGLTSAAYGKNSIAQGLYADAYGEGAIAFGHETVSGAHVTITPNENIEDAHTTDFNVSTDGITNRTLVDGSVVGVDKNSIYKVSTITTTEDGSTQELELEINSIGNILSVSNVPFNTTGITLKSDSDVRVARDDATGYYYYTKDDKKVLVGSDEILTFTSSNNKVDIAAGKMTLSSGGISFGSYSHAEGDRSLAMGRVAGAYDKNSTAVGLFANALGEGSMAIGHNATAGAKVTVEEVDADIHTTSMNLDGGSPVRSGGIGGIAIGSYAHAEGDRAISVGRASGAYDTNSTAIGLYANAFGEDAMAIGHNATAGAKVTTNEDDPNYYTAVMTLQDGTGIRSTMADGTETKGGIAIGSYAHAVGDRAIAFGRVSGAYGDNSTAMGIYSNALGQGAIAIGHGSSTGVEVTVNPTGADGSAERADGFWTTELNTDTVTGNPISNNNDGGIAIGSYAHTEGTRALAVGRVAGAYGTNSTVVGLRSNAYGEGSIAFGHGVTAGDKEHPYNVQIEALHNNPDLDYDLDGVTGNANEKVDPTNVVGAVAIGSYAEATGRGSLSVGRYSKASSAYSTTLGIRASVLESAENAIAIGREATVDTVSSGRDYGGINSIAMGTLTYVRGQNSIAIGTADMLSEDGKSIVGVEERKATTVTGDSSIAIGKYDTVEGNSSVAIGDKSAVTGNKSIAIGTENTVKGDGSGAIGDPNVVVGDSSYILGNSSEIGSVGTAATATAPATADIAVKNAFIIGNTSKISDAAAEGGLIYGSNAEVTKKNGLALGNNTSVSVADGVALGSDSIADTDKEVAGYDPVTKAASTKTDEIWKSTAAAVSVGGNGVTRQITNVAAGYEETDAVNVAQLKAARVELQDGTNTTVTKTQDGTDGHTIYKVNVDNPVHFYSVNSTDSTAGNYNNNGATGTNAIAAGVNAKATGNNSVAIGTGATAAGTGAVVLGSGGAKATGNYALASNKGSASGEHSAAFGSGTASGNYSAAFGFATNATNWGAAAWGANSLAKGYASTAFGEQSHAYGDNSLAAAGGTTGTVTSTTYGEGAVAIGKGAVAQTSNTYAIGTNAKVVTNRDDGIAFGNSAEVQVAGGAVALGSNAIAKTAKEKAGYDPATNAASGKTDETWKFTAAALSVGGGTVDGKTVTRQITNVAAGTNNTDAVNVAQLKAARVELQKGTNTTLTKENDATDGHTIYKVNANKAIVQNKAGDELVTVTSDTSADGLTTTYEVTVKDMHVASGVASYGNVAGGTEADGTATLTHKDGETAVIKGLKNTYIKSGTFADNKITLTRNDNENIVINGIAAQTDLTHYYSVKAGQNLEPGSNYNNEGATGTLALAAGPYAGASGDYSVAIGYNAKANEKNAIAIGNGATAEGEGAIVLGSGGATATNTNAMAWGYLTKAEGPRATAWGDRAEATGQDATAWGTETHATEVDATAWGSFTKATSTDATAWGTRSNATNVEATAFGNGTTAEGIRATAFGYRTTAGRSYTDDATGNKIYTDADTAFGILTTATGQASTAFGENTKATGKWSTAFGYNSQATGEMATAWGGNSIASGNQATAFSENTIAAGENAAAFGNASIIPPLLEILVKLMVKIHWQP